MGKFLSVDPLTRGYPMLTPYQFASNTPIAAIDLDGLESQEAVTASKEVSKATMKVLYKKAVEETVKESAWITGAKFVGQRALGVIGFLLSPAPLSNSDTPLPIDFSPELNQENEPVPIPETDNCPDDDLDDEYITLYRGVSEHSPAYPDALAGVAIPRGGNATASEHNSKNTKSPFTSWSTEEWVAEENALSDHETEDKVLRTDKGVILTKKFKKNDPRLVPSIDRYGESEVLILGPVSGANSKVIKDNTVKPKWDQGSGKYKDGK